MLERASRFESGARDNLNKDGTHIMSSDYLLGLVTLPAIAVVIVIGYLITYTFRPTGAYRVEPCPHCVALGWKDLAYYQDEHDHVSRLSWWLRVRYHRWFLARRHPHRVLWQARADNHPSLSQRAFLQKSRRKYGTTAH
jgi:hypothetical protein